MPEPGSAWRSPKGIAPNFKSYTVAAFAECHESDHSGFKPNPKQPPKRPENLVHKNRPTHSGPMKKNKVEANVLLDITINGMQVYPTTATLGIKVLKAGDAKKLENSKCVNDMIYHSINKGQSKTGLYKNVLKRNSQVVKQHHNQMLQAQYNFTIALSEGVNTLQLQLQLDHGNLVNEANENNNMQVQKIKVIGRCMSLSGQVGGKPKPTVIKK